MEERREGISMLLQNYLQTQPQLIYYMQLYFTHEAVECIFNTIDSVAQSTTSLGSVYAQYGERTVHYSHVV